jgi:undecaprenyl diphosphate synthase
MDGNGRWAQRRGLPRSAGHQAGVKATRRVVEACARRHIEALTLFAFSSENWRRPNQEVSLLMDIFLRTLKREVSKIHQNDIRIRFIGELREFSAKLREQMDQAEQVTRENGGMDLVIAVNYGGRWDITQAARQIAKQVLNGSLQPADVTAEVLSRYLSLSDLPEPDLFIRTGGESRISNYLLWQLAYTELYFTDLLWPDFDEPALEAALSFFRGRQRRFGRTGDQAKQPQHA